MKMAKKNLKGKGICDYDYKHDILFFKTKNREYEQSIEISNMVLDIDKEKFIVGIQIFEASEFLGITKQNLLKIPKWNFLSKFDEGKIEVRLDFQIVVRNKIINKNPIIIQPTPMSLPDSELVCVKA